MCLERGFCLNWRAAQQGDEADEAFGGTVTRQKCRLMPAPVNFGRGHRFAAYPRCSADIRVVEDVRESDTAADSRRGVRAFTEAT